MNIYEISIRPHAQMLLRAAIVAMILIGVALLAGRASAQVVAQKVTLRSVVTVADAVVLLGDLAEGAGEKAGAKLFLAPAPGTTGTVQADRVVDAIRRAGIAEVETGGITEVVVSRSGRRIPREEITRAIATELVHRGHARNADQLEIRLDSSVGGFIVESTAAGAIRVMSIQADPRARRFAAKVTVDGSATAARGIEITGYAEEVASVPTLSRPVQRGDTIAPADVIVERLPVSMISEDAIVSVEAIAGMAARRALHPGQPLRSGDLMEPILVHRDDVVAIVFNRPGLSLTVRGRAVSNGARGDVIAVTNLQSNRILQAEITGPGTVAVHGSATRIAAAN
ncbi:MAG: flagellar basal body P-ring formation chaperone FlgA [Tepidamorphaceae bacterium]